ncbi:metal ABC transporter permease [Sphingobacteriales bacterium UPWRP_1]|nr:iron ABC transporter [Sphingobacteriales bacterium TSM_CSS]PSJ74656.1 metal ABC transporter permease [Sphingobacteriales bacterium UPWRP_1]
MNAFWIILTGSLVGASCGLLGCYLILRRMAMIGDAISHAVLPGIFLAFWIAGTRASVPVLLGTAAFGVLATFLIEWFSRKGNFQADAAIGMVFTFLFAVGIILISAFAGQVELDQECVLYGEIAYVPLDIWTTSGGINLGPRTVWTMGAALLLVLTLIAWGYKGLYITTFDPGYAQTLGIKTGRWHYLLMGAVSFTTVLAFDSVGAILVVAFLIAPAAIASLLTNRFGVMLLLSVMAAVLAAAGGYGLAAAINGSVAGAMATMLGILFGLAFLFSPLQGVVFKWWRNKNSPAAQNHPSV